MLRTRLALVALLSSLACVLVGVAPAHAAVAAPVAVPSPAIADEQATFTGTVPPRAGRAVRLEERRGTRWVAVATGRSGSTGRYALTAALPHRSDVSVAYRVVAPRARVAGAVRPKVVTPTRTVRTVQQTGALRYATTGSAPVSTTWTATFTPARAGRVVVFEEKQVDGTWAEQSRTTQGAAGGATFATSYTSGSHEVRATTLASRGAAAQPTPTYTVTVASPL